MLTYPFYALLLGSSSVAVTAKAGHHRNRHLPNQKEFEKELYGKSKQSAVLRDKFISKSKFVGGRKLQNNGYYSNGNYAANNNNNNNNYNFNNNYNNNYNNGEAGAAYDQYQGSEVDADGEEYTYDEDGNRVYSEFDGYAFNPSNYAMAYHRCASVKQFDTDVASDEDAEVVFTTKTFAIFRLCPVNSCDEYTEGVDEEEEEQSDDAAADDAAADDAAADDAAADDAAAEEDAEEEDAAAEEQNENAYYNANTKKYGARGKGCKRNYGEYMIELQDYVEIMFEYQQGRLTTYCNVCEQDMYEQYMNNYDDDDGHDDDGGRKLFSFSSSSSKTYEEFKSDPASHRMLEGNYNLCRQYANVCGTYGDDDDGDDDDESYAEEYMQCTQAGDYYTGPHCSDDGFTITLGAHSDDECTEYIGDVAESNDDDDDGGDDDAGGDDDDADDDADADDEEFDVMSYINSRYGGLSLLYEGQESSMCIPCNQDDDFSFEYDDDGNDDDDDDGNDDDDDDGNGGGGGAMSELCQQLYESSAHCERNYQTFNKKYLTDAQWKNEQLSCSYMDSIAMGNYDEMGYVNFKWRWGLWGNNNYRNKEGDGNILNASTYAATSRRVSALQGFLLVFTCLSCAILGVWAKTLHSSLTKREPWSPRGASRWNMKNIFCKEQVQAQQPQVAPSDSGIGASRVRSDGSDGTSYYLS